MIASSHHPSNRVLSIVHRMVIGSAMLISVTAGLVLPPTARADGCGALAVHAGMSPNARTIAVLEGQDPANCPSDATVGFIPMTPNQRSIQLVESKEAPGGILAGLPAPPLRIPYEESERAVAANGDATAHLAPQPASPHVAAY